MKCTYHPDREAVGACVNCGRLICGECKTINDNKSYCATCSAKLFQATPTVDKIVPELEQMAKPNWFRRHLNWVAFLALVAQYPLIIAVEALILFINPRISTETVNAIAFVVAGLSVLVISGWVLVEKNRSLWYLPWLAIPLGWIVFLFLENHSFKLTSGEESIEDIPWEVLSKMPSNQQTLESASGEKEALKHVIGKCPYCDSASVSQKIVEGPLSEREREVRGYYYEWNCKCSDCKKEWLGVE